MDSHSIHINIVLHRQCSVIMICGFSSNSHDCTFSTGFLLIKNEWLTPEESCASHCLTEICVWSDWDDCFTWSQLLNAPIAATNIHRQEIFEPVDLWIGVSAGCTQHCSRTRSFHNLQLGAHVYGGEAVWYLVLCKTDKHTSALLDTIQTSLSLALSDFLCSFHKPSGCKVSPREIQTQWNPALM